MRANCRAARRRALCSKVARARHQNRIVWHRSSSKAGQNANANLSVTEARHNSSGTSMLSMVSNPAVSHARPRHKLATPVNAIETANEFVGL